MERKHGVAPISARQSEGGGEREERREKEMEHNIDYLIMHFIISVTIECLPSLVAQRTRAAVPPLL